MKAVVLLSGGLDSTTCLGIAKDEGYTCYPLTFEYGQRHSKEIACAKKIVSYYDLNDKYKIISLDFFKLFANNSLINKEIMPNTSGLSKGIPNTYVPARNLIFLSIAAGYAKNINADTLFLGVSAVDYSGYPDCRKEFIASFMQTVQLALPTKLTIKAPLVDLSKSQTISLGLKLKVPYHLTTSCYFGAKKACGKCDSCILRLKGFKDLGLKDPISYS